MSTKILVAVDFSPVTPLVIGWATSIARQRQAELILVHVQEPIAENLGGELYFPAPVHENPELRKALLALKPDDESVAYGHELLIGTAADAILKLARQAGVELIVMGSHGRRGLGRLLMGSVAEGVLRRAECPVFVVKQPVDPQPGIASADRATI